MNKQRNIKCIHCNKNIGKVDKDLEIKQIEFSVKLTKLEKLKYYEGEE